MYKFIGPNVYKFIGPNVPRQLGKQARFSARNVINRTGSGQFKVEYTV